MKSTDCKSSQLVSLHRLFYLTELNKDDNFHDSGAYFCILVCTKFFIFFVNLQAQRHGLTSWMEEMDVFLHVEDPTKGDLPTLQAQLEESSVSYGMKVYSFSDMAIFMHI